MSLRGLDPRLCATCRGRNWCGLSYCPLLARRLASIKVSRVVGAREIYGSSPPSIFVGRQGYPSVSVGPSAPPESGDTSVYDSPETWIDAKLEAVIDYRLSLLTGSTRLNVRDLNNSFIEKIHELVLSIKPVDVEIYLERPPIPRVELSEHEPPQGPRAPIRDFKIVGNPSVPRVVDRVHGDRDLSARSAVLILYESGLPISAIQRIFSAGALGKSERRRLVPTRWSITAVDSIVSEELLEVVKSSPSINEFEVYVRRHYDNLFVAVLAPGKWSYEWIEAWWPGSTWNPSADEIVVEGDYEGYFGRTSYPSIGGCYFAARLAVAEHFARRGRQGVAMVFREIYRGFNIPIGVWFVRENVRRLLSEGPALKTSSLREVVDAINRETKLGSSKWIESSRLLRSLLFQHRIDEFLGRV